MSLMARLQPSWFWRALPLSGAGALLLAARLGFSQVPPSNPPPSTDTPATQEQPSAPRARRGSGGHSSGSRSFRGRGEDEWLRVMSERSPVRMVSRHSSTAIVFRIDLGNGVEIGFKPERPGQEPWWRHEIVSYRFARLLGIENMVPPVVGRTLPASIFGRYAQSDNLIVRGGAIHGSASVWMPALHGENLHTGEARRQWVSWMNPANPIPSEHSERARQISIVLVFDFLMANFDRWNCCNIPIDEHGDVIMRDNDAGWYASVMNRLGSPSNVRRLPRSVWEAIRRTDSAALRAEIERDPMASEGLIQRDSYAAYDNRRQALIRQIERMVRQYGEDAVFPWP